VQSVNAPPLVVIMGPTATGKTAVAESLADEFGAALINADAFQVYRGMDIGTSKSQRKAEYDLIDICDPSEQYGVGAFIRDACQVLQRHFLARRPCVLVGGTGLYIRALTERYTELAPPPDENLRKELVKIQEIEGIEGLLQRLNALAPQAMGALDLKNPVRVRRALERAMAPPLRLEVSLPLFTVTKICILPSVEQINSNIQQRTTIFMQNCWADEVKSLLQIGVGETDPGFRAIGYRQLAKQIQGDMEPSITIERIVRETQQYAKRQRTWFKSEPNAVKVESANEALQLARSAMQGTNE
jgi:tRNA dimethylallyltransferase